MEIVTRVPQDDPTNKLIEECLRAFASEKGVEGSSPLYLNHWLATLGNRRLTFHIPGIGFIFGTKRTGRVRHSIEAEIHCIYVSPAYRGKQFRKLLYDKYESYIVETADELAAEASIIVSLKPCIRNQKAFWESVGFTLPLTKDDDTAMTKTVRKR